MQKKYILIYILSILFLMAGAKASFAVSTTEASQTEGFNPAQMASGQIDTPALNQDQEAPAVRYVSKTGGNQDGLSWETAWNELNQIDWTQINPGDTIIVDGGSLAQSMVYTSTLEPAVSGTEELPITIQLSDEEGREGTAVIFGGNSIPLPECGQLEWDESELNEAGNYGMVFRNGVSNIVVDGTRRGGFVLHGWRLGGITLDPDRTDDQVDNNTQNITLRYLEIFNNGRIERLPDLLPSGEGENAGPELYYPYHGSAGIKLAGTGHKFEFLEVHDNAADAIQSNFTDPSNGIFNNMDDITITSSWFYNQRAHSGIDNSPAGEVCTADDTSGCDEMGAPSMSAEYFRYPAEPTARREAFNWCTHNDGIQIYSAEDFNNLVIERSVMGPNLMNALILGDRGEPVKTTAWVNNLVMNDVVITRFTNNALGMNNNQPNVGSNWQINQTTVYGHFNKENMASFSVQSNSDQIEHTVSNTINVFGRSEFPDGNIDLLNNCEFNMYTGSIGGVVENPNFFNVNASADIFEDDLSVDFASVFLDDYTPTSQNCRSVGSQLTSISQLWTGEKTVVEFEDTAPEADTVSVEPTIAPTIAPTIEPTPVEVAEVDNSQSTTDVDDSAAAPPVDSAEPEAESSSSIFDSINITEDEVPLLIGLGIVMIILSILLLLLIYLAWQVHKGAFD